MFPFDFQMVMHGGQSSAKRLCIDEEQNNYCAITTLCCDLLFIILLPLPVKTLFRLKLVSKEFNDVISSRIFGITHARTHHMERMDFGPTGLYFNNSFSNIPEICSISLSSSWNTIPNLTFFERIAYHCGRHFKIVQSCNGLLLCSFDNASSPLARVYIVCNPTTRAYIFLPKLPTIESLSSKSKIEQDICHPILTLAFNPLQMNDYKVFAVRVIKQLARKCTCEILIYSSDKGCRLWRKSDCQFFISPKMKRIHHGVFHDDGLITWVCETGFIHFNVEEENIIGVRKGAMHSSTWEKIKFFGESIHGGLYLIKPITGSGIKVCQLKPGTSLWEDRWTMFLKSKMHGMKLWIEEHNYYSDYNMQGYCTDNYQILAIANGGKVLIVAINGLVFGCCQQSSESQVMKLMPQQFHENFRFGGVTSFQFVETLFPV